MNNPTLTFLTDFADQAVILPLVAVVALVLCAQRRWRVAAAWLIVIPGVLGIVLTLKMACYACGWLVPALGPDRWALQSPSGHAASAAVTYGGIAALSAARTRISAAPATLAAMVTALCLAALIGATRVQLGAHSLSEVVLAASIGIAGAIAFARLAGRHIVERSGMPVMAGALFVLILFHGKHLASERILQHAAAQMLRQLVTACQVG